MTYSGGRLTPANPSDSAVAQALAFAAAGVPVFPVWGVRLEPPDTWTCACGRPTGEAGHNAGKHPATPHGHNDAVLASEDQARAWLADGTRNLALPTGNGLVVVDVDPRHGGHDTVDDWESWTNGTSLPHTLRVETGSGGIHLYYMVPAGARVVSRNMVLPGVDIKSDGGYVVGPTARHVAGGLYRWLDPEVPVATVPADLLTWLMTRRGGSSGGGAETPDGYDFRAGGVVGQRDAYANDLAFQLRKKGVSWNRALQVMREAWEKMEQPEGDWFAWEVALEKLQRMWRDQQPDPLVQRPSWPGVLDPPLATTSGGAPGGPTEVSGDGEVPPGGPPLVGTIVVGPMPEETASDLGNAARFVRLCGDRVRYVPDEGGWYVWDGSILVPDRMNRALEMTKEVITDIREQAMVEQDATMRGRWAQHALTTESIGKRQAILTSAAAESAITVPIEALDSDPMLLVVDNGTLDLRTGAIRPSRLDDLCTRRADVWHDPEAVAPRWLAHVDLVTGGDPALAAYLQRACGYSLTGLVSEQKFWFLWGAGSNGKNVFTETILEMLGSYAQAAPMGLITGDGEHPTILAGLRGARMVMSDETGAGKKMNDARLKMLTGSAKISARYMGKDFFQFDSTMKLWILGNAKPVIRDTSEGMWRRMQLVPFTATIPPDRRIMQYTDQLREERSGILNWCLEGLRAWQEQGGVGAPVAVAAATSTYRIEEDYVGQFLAQCTVADMDAFVTSASLYQSYQIWTAMNGLHGREEVLNKITFGRELGARGFLTSQRKKVAGKTALCTVGLRLAGEDIDGHGSI